MKITLRAVVTWIAAALAIAAFIFSFGAGIIYKGDNMSIEITGLIFGKQETITTTKILGAVSVENSKPLFALVGQIGVIMVLVGAVLAALAGTLLKKNSKPLFMFLAVVILVGAIMVLFIKTGWIEAQVQDAFKDIKEPSENLVDSTRENLTDLYEEYGNNTNAILTSVLGLISAAAVALAGLIKQKKSRK